MWLKVAIAAAILLWWSNRSKAAAPAPPPLPVGSVEIGQHSVTFHDGNGVWDEPYTTGSPGGAANCVAEGIGTGRWVCE